MRSLWICPAFSLFRFIILYLTLIVKSLTCCLCFMTFVANGLQIPLLIGAAKRFGLDMVHGLGASDNTLPPARLAQIVISGQDTGSEPLPLSPITPRLSALTLLMLLPAFVTMGCAIAGTLGRGIRATGLTASSGDEGRHGNNLYGLFKQTFRT